LKRLYNLLLVVLLSLLIGCAETQNVARTKTAQGTVIGAATGALAGALIASHHHRGKGALIGGLAGAAVGGGIGYALDRRAKELAQIKEARVRREHDRLVVTMSDSILFDINSASLRPGAKRILDKIASVIVRYPDDRIVVAGYTDNTGSEKYNQELSERRAKVVRNYLVLKGVLPDRITAIGFGEAMPVASNATPEGRQQNRRVEIEIKPADSAQP